MRNRMVLLNLTLVGILLIASLVVIYQLLGGRILSSQQDALNNTVDNLGGPYSYTIATNITSETSGVTSETSGVTSENSNSSVMYMMRSYTPEGDLQIFKVEGEDVAHLPEGGIFMLLADPSITILTLDASDQVKEIASTNPIEPSIDYQELAQQARQAKDGDIISQNNRQWLGSVAQIANDPFSTVVLLEISETYRSLSALAWTCVGIGAVVLFLVAVISWLFAKRSIRPLAAALEQQNRFVADASHELRTPLSVIKTNAQLMAAEPEKTVGEQHEWLENIQNEATAMTRLTDDLLTLSLSATPSELKLAPLDLNAWLSEQLVSLEVLASEQGHRLESQISLPEGSLVKTDADTLRRILAILLENALTYSDPKSCITITTHQQNGEAQLRVSNTGTPIPPEDIPHIFERFYRVDKVRGLSEGFGLGLSVARELANQLQATIHVSSTAEQTSFTLGLPLG
jgi:signal transduction histidine kinase